MASPGYASTATRATIVNADDMDTIVSTSPTKRCRMDEEFEEDGGDNYEDEEDHFDIFNDDDL